jgi:hypothetical protein
MEPYGGAWQFSVGTWQSVGGVGLPNRATPGEQDYRAWRLYETEGWGPWETAPACERQWGST